MWTHYSNPAEITIYFDYLYKCANKWMSSVYEVSTYLLEMQSEGRGDSISLLGSLHQDKEWKTLFTEPIAFAPGTLPKRESTRLITMSASSFHVLHKCLLRVRNLWSQTSKCRCGLSVYSSFGQPETYVTYATTLFTRSKVDFLLGPWDIKAWERPGALFRSLIRYFLYFLQVWYQYTFSHMP